MYSDKPLCRRHCVRPMPTGKQRGSRTKAQIKKSGRKKAFSFNIFCIKSEMIIKHEIQSINQKLICKSTKLFFFINKFNRFSFCLGKLYCMNRFNVDFFKFFILKDKIIFFILFPQKNCDIKINIIIFVS